MKTFTSSSTTAYGITAIRSGSPIQYATLNASGQKFYLGGSTSSYCPSEIVKDCPPGTQTAIAPSGNALDVEVPGGQQIYVDPTGAVSFTQAHSASMPAGSVQGGFTFETQADVTYWLFKGDGLLACPTSDNRYQVFAPVDNLKVPSGNKDDCLGFSARGIPYTDAAPAWQYS
ncbi:secreted protein [Penicillium diatomitis]|uniref:Secreted protein n=1 Tax=Penicillium diatomitis TaxID=2819901 RepID=A0A9W9XI58_9EURO|nr:uncharacterized protein N7539_002192 [Penicillium diatomitis]KAJ5493446.1 secreted protein [Penicillium diatomitis]